MMTALSKVDYQKLHQHLGRLLPPGGRPLNAEEVVDVGELREKIARCAAEAASRVERGVRVLAWRIPCDVAPTQNELNSWQARSPWRPKKAKHWLENEIRKLIAATPGLDLCGAQKQRWVRLTRWTAQPKHADDNAPDLIGGKFPIDMLVKAGVLVDDTPRWLMREGQVRKTKLGNTHILLELGEVAPELVFAAEPEDGLKPDFAWPKSPTKKHVEAAFDGKVFR